MSTEQDLITSVAPAMFHEAGYARAAREDRPWYLIYRESTDEMGISPCPEAGDDIISVYEPETLP